MRTSKVVLTAVAATLAVTMSACTKTDSGSGDGSGGTASGASSAEPVADGGVGNVWNPSDAKGGTVRYAITEDWDSTDPGDTYYGLSWNLLRNYARTLVVFKSSPDNPQLVPDLATSLGKSSDDAKTWTYTLRDGLKYEDGTPITSKDIKYAVARQLDKDTFPNGPTYFNDLLADVPDGYSVYKNKNLDALTSIETPDDKTIVFHLKSPFSGFDYLAQLPATAPVPQAKDDGSKYKEHVVSSGPYKFESYSAKERIVLTQNTNYDPATDPDSGRKQLADKLQIDLGVEASDLDQRLQSGDLDVDLAGTGVTPQTQAKILADPKLQAQTDSAAVARTWFSVISESVAPFDNIECRKAVLYAFDAEGYQRAYGGKTGGDIAGGLLPPMIPGHVDIDPWGKQANPTGDAAKAKEALTKCGQPNGFSTKMAFRADRPKEKAMAESMQQSLAKVGIKLELKGYPTGDYFKLYAGKPDFVKQNGLGILAYGWGADWPDGYGFLAQIVDSRTIRDAGNTNLGIKLPEVDKMIDKALLTTDEAERNKIWGEIDTKVTESGLVIPGIYSKGLLFRPTNITNVFVNPAFGQYDYTTIGTTNK